MKPLMSFSAVLGLVLCGSLAVAAELNAGLKKGDPVGAFMVEKCAGNLQDGIEPGAQLCYRCKLGNRPVVAIFTRNVGENVSTLVKQLDQLVSDNPNKNFASFVNLLGNDPAKLKADAHDLLVRSKAKNIAVVVPDQHKFGPSNLKLHPDADVTVLIYSGGTVAANHAFAAGKLDKPAITAVLADTKKIL